MSLLSWIYGDDENAARGEAASAALRQIQLEKTGSSRLVQDDRVGWDGVETQSETVSGQQRDISSAFDEGWDDGKKNVTGFVGGFFKVVGDVLSSVLLGIPFWIWALAGIFLWGWLGFPGLSKLKKKLA